jgi:hypothetical protein
MKIKGHRQPPSSPKGEKNIVFNKNINEYNKVGHNEGGRKGYTYRGKLG